MCRTQYVLALLPLYMGLAHSFSWDFVAAAESRLEFNINGQHTRSDDITSHSIEYFTYDAVGNRIFFVDLRNTNTTIFSYDISTKTVESLVPKEIGVWQSIQGIAFDPVEKLLFWGDSESNIYWFSLKPGFENNVYGNLLYPIPANKYLSFYIYPAVDSCRGYIYWASEHTMQNYLPSTIERARYDGSDREVLIDSNLDAPRNLVIDQLSQKMYWTDGIGGGEKHIFIESADLNGKNRTRLYSETGTYQPISLAVSNDSIYWVHMDQNTVYQLSKNPSIHEKPTEISIGLWYARAIAINYKIEDQIRGIRECEGLKRLLPNDSEPNDNVSLNISSELSLFCNHGKKVSGKSQCQCTHGYTGERCDVSVCQNYCFQGDCIVSAEEQPTCRCNAGYSGERCQVNDCQGYCMNDGICSMNEKNKPVCQCKGHYEGERCDVSTYKCFQKVVSMVWNILNADITQATLDTGVKSACASTTV